MELQDIPVTPNNKKVRLDPAGYFLIRLNKQLIEVGFCTSEHIMLYRFAGVNAVDLSKAIAHQNLPISIEHALYLGRELERAETALQNNQEYIQD